MSTRRHSRALGAFVALTSATALAVSLGLAPAGAADGGATTTNPVSKSFADSFADPSVIQAKDGWWYAYSTADPLRSGDPSGIMHIARTRDFVTWDYRGTVFDETNRPSWATPTSGLWAPDIRYINGQYVIYYTVTDTTLNPGDDSAIGVATSPSPEGPWTPTNAPIVAPRPDGGGFLWTFDPAGFTDVDGQNYLYFGSYYGGNFVTKVSRDGLTPMGGQTQVAIGDRYEGSYVQRHEGWYYYSASSANCCAGPTTGYAVFAGRSRSPLGPFVDQDGIPLTASAVGGTNVVHQNGNRWIGVGHHAVATDASGRDFLAYHGLDRNEPWLNEPFGVTRRPMLLDRLDWVDEWPRTRAGAGPSDSPQPAPVTGSLLGITDHDPAAGGFTGGMRTASDPQGGASAVVNGTAKTPAAAPAGSLRVRLDVKGDQPLTVTVGAHPKTVSVTVDPRRNQLSLTTGIGANRRTVTDTLRDAAGWQTLVVEVSGTKAMAQVAESDLGDPAAEVSLERTGFKLGSAPISLASSGALVDNVTVRPLAVEANSLVDVPEPVSEIVRDDFTTGLDSAWQWLRKDPNATVSGGQLTWPLQAADLVGTGNNASLLLRDVPASGDWIAETKFHLDLGTDTIRNYQQAGMIVHETDDDFARLGSVAIWKTRQSEFGRELPTEDGRLSFGGSLIGTPAATMWMRIAHHENAAGEHIYRAATSRDGTEWTWGSAWTFPAGATPQIGLYAHGGDQPPVSAKFDYFSVSTATWPAAP
ncbi:family 43 glycosylhydrolase [Knoellia sp. S7-12]|uniref:family 43 glycosylhydrolase n=1 Tax=Knoellia sp. S7-12 TaxID=3126698 RepID=UPI0033684FE9